VRKFKMEVTASIELGEIFIFLSGDYCHIQNTLPKSPNGYPNE
jgi:hypothetical protein